MLRLFLSVGKTIISFGKIRREVSVTPNWMPTTPASTVSPATTALHAFRRRPQRSPRGGSNMGFYESGIEWVSFGEETMLLRC